MIPWHWIKIGFLILTGYLVIGSTAVLIRAYIAALLGGNWFSQGNRWGGGEIIPAVLLFLWPIVIPGYLVYGIVVGWIKCLEYLGDKVIESGRIREKKLRGANK